MADKEKSEATGAPEVPKHLSKDLDGEVGEEAEKPTKTVEEKESNEAEAETTPLDDDKTDQAIDDIVKTESDDLLAAQDRAMSDTESKSPKKRRWWKSGRFWKITILLLVVAASALFAVEATRHWILNSLGVRSSASVLVLDSTTGQPLKNVTVTIAQSQAKTDAEGKAKLEKLKLGNFTLTLERVAFAKQEHGVTIGWGSNPLGTYKLKATGAQYNLSVVDYLSGKSIIGAEVSNQEAAAVSNNEGQVVLTLEDTTAEQVNVKVSAAGFRTEEVTVPLEATEPTKVVLVPSTKTVFVSKESGKYDLYSMDIDGKNKKVLLAATGLESGNITVAPSPDGQQVALVSTRDNVRAADGMLLSTLTLVDVASGNTVSTDRGEQLQVLDWIDNRVIYHMVVSGQTSDSATRQRIISYDYKANSRAQLASANQIRSAASASGKVYFTDGVAYYKINPDGNNKEQLLDKPVWATYRTDYDNLSLQTEEGWYRLALGSGAATEIAEPVSYANRIYNTNVKGNQSLWIEKSNLHVFVIEGAKDSVLHTQGGLVYPARWLTNTDIIYRVSAGQEVADYAISSEGGEARKLANVIGTSGPVQNY